jgi:hypothetical protein
MLVAFVGPLFFVTTPLLPVSMLMAMPTGTFGKAISSFKLLGSVCVLMTTPYGDP